MHPGELWQHRRTRAVVRIEVRREGLLSFSVREGRAWKMNPHIWTEEDFLRDFEPFGPQRGQLQDVLGDKQRRH